ncbi:MAG: hypothetical protein RBR69_06955 [Candidatus Cloacimonadaceae bacterium]|nr:hypothetical protein [Candidatus Cloacimonadota bacterium]MDY0127850.1 hypothetical protein [Candidatus Cloacimonadaceae bacterium]MCB5255306.1 hypothetical protein [Candidatus Cloacimonadota bacterium]MCK9178355.1 hypothetical protein [Candidatus Cloacimonadota bacterium]MCK9242130.1 hypothetical protein [Candidatus Cloacimonadota bacterium]
MNRTMQIIGLLLIILLVGACTKKNNLTGTNWSDYDAQSFEDSGAVVSGYSFPADSLLSITSNRKNLLVGNWQGSRAMSILRFTDLPADTTIASYYEITDLNLDIVLRRRNEVERNPLTLNFYKVHTGWAANPDTLSEEDYTMIPGTSTVVASSVSGSDTLSVPLPYDLIQSWQADADSTGLNILIKAENDGFVELGLSTPTQGSKIRFKYKETSSDEEQSEFARFATFNSYSFTHPEVEPRPGEWVLSNFAPQRMYVDLQPDYGMFKSEDGATLSPEELKRTSINKAELVLYIKDDLPNYQNTYSYKVSALLLKERPEDGAIIPTTDIYIPEFISSLQSTVNSSSDSILINITPIIQAYVSEKTFSDGVVISPQGIVIMSNYERKDFGEVEFYHPLTAPEGKKAYIRIKYTPPFL